MAATALLLGACSAAPSQASGPGWHVLRVQDGDYPFLQVVRISENQLVVSFGVLDGCPIGGAAAPSFVGFETKGDALVAMVTRTPDPSSPCVVFHGRTFDVQLDIQSIPDSAHRIVLGGQACPPDDDICNGLSAPMPFTPPTIPPSGAGG